MGILMFGVIPSIFNNVQNNELIFLASSKKDQWGFFFVCFKYHYGVMDFNTIYVFRSFAVNAFEVQISLAHERLFFKLAPGSFDTTIVVFNDIFTCWYNKTFETFLVLFPT